MSKKKTPEYQGPDEKGVILVVEDSPDSINLIRSTLEDEEYHVLIATSGESALERINMNKPDLILLDVILPGIDGYETCARIKNHSEWNEIPVIFLSVLSDPDNKVAGFATGAVDYLIKPYSAEELLARVKTHLSLSRLHNQVLLYSKDLEDRLDEIDSFTNMISHDLRTPVRAIDGFAHLLSSTDPLKDAEHFSHYLGKIHENVRTINQLIEDLLKISRMSRKKIEHTSIDMKTLATSVVHEIQDAYPLTKFDIVINDIPPAFGDHYLIRQVFVNLLSNAMKFSQTKIKPTIVIGYEASENGGEYYVRDNGIGFDMRYTEKIFDIFFSLPQTTEYGGTGVGLTIVKRIITKHNGKIRVESKQGFGTTFFFTLHE